MRHGEEYNWMDPQLRHDREVCRVLLSYFNNSASSISPGERERQLRLILESDVKPQMHSPTPSRLGKNVSVETPFRCDYGYSLNIRDHVVIEAGCVIMDAAEVEIREGAHIGTDVRITSKVVPQDPRARVDRLGGQIRKAKGIRVIIEESVYIGDGALIAPEWDAKGGGGDDDDGGLLRIGMNSYILPGTIVRKVSVCGTWRRWKLTMRLEYSSEHGVQKERKRWARCASLLGVVILHPRCRRPSQSPGQRLVMRTILSKWEWRDERETGEVAMMNPA